MRPRSPETPFNKKGIRLFHNKVRVHSQNAHAKGRSRERQGFQTPTHRYLRRILLLMQANRAPALPNDCLAQEIQFDPQMDGFAYYLASRATGSKGSKIPAPTRYFIAVAHLRSNAKQQT